MSWWETIPTVLALVGLLVGPGLAFGALAGLRGVILAGAAPAIGCAMVGGTTVLADRLGWAWSPWTYGAGALALAGIGAGIGWWRRRAGNSWAGTLGPALGRAQVIGLVLSGLVVAVLALRVITDGMVAPDALAQTWDTTFHLNGVQAIREFGNASPFGGFQSLYGDRAPQVYYPTVWHAIVALAPGSVPVAANASTLVIAVLVWPLGLAALARAAVPGLPWTTVFAPVVGATFIAFPTVVLSTSGQWPNGLSVAVTPGALALAVLALRSWRDTGFGGVLVVLPALAGVPAAHASGAFFLVVVLLPVLVGVEIRLVVAAVRAGRWWWGALAVLATVTVAALAWWVLSGSPILTNMINYHRAPTGTFEEGVRAGLLDVPLWSETPPNTWVLGCVAVGVLATLVRREGRWLIFGWAVSVLFVALAMAPESELRWLTAFWYKSVPRIAALVPITGAVLGAFGIVWLGHLCSRLLARLGTRDRWLTIPVVAVPVLVLGIGWIVSDGFREADKVDRMQQAYVPEKIRFGAQVSTAETAFLRTLGDVLPDDALLLGDPFNGAALAYASSGVDVVHKQLSAGYADPAMTYFELGFNKIHTDPQVCEYVRQYGVTHFYADEPGWIEATDVATRWPGLYGVDVSTGFELVASEGHVGVYLITACD